MARWADHRLLPHVAQGTNPKSPIQRAGTWRANQSRAPPGGATRGRRRGIRRPTIAQDDGAPITRSGTGPGAPATQPSGYQHQDQDRPDHTGHIAQEPGCHYWQIIAKEDRCSNRDDDWGYSPRKPNITPVHPVHFVPPEIHPKHGEKPKAGCCAESSKEYKPNKVRENPESPDM